MNDEEQIMTRYLLGELSEAERAVLEEKYFSDPRTFDQVLKTESDLVDNYVRGRLSARARTHFESFYLAHPQRRERVKFAEALATKLDQDELPSRADTKPTGPVARWQQLFSALRGQGLIWQASLALASLLIVLGGAWFFIESRQQRRELAQTRAVQESQERRVRELEQQLASERNLAEELTAELERLQQAQQQSSQTRSTPSFATLLLTVGGVRSTDPGRTPTLVIPPGAAHVRLQLNLKEPDHTDYRATLQAAGGEQVFNWQVLKPATTKSGARLMLTLPAGKLATGDYILTLKAVSPTGELEDLSKSIFRVKK